jgi:ABC-2 type transport system permease protein
MQQVDDAQEVGQQRLDARLAQLEQDRDNDLDAIERNLEMQVRQVQDSYKLRAVLIPPIPPLLLAFFVFFHRRQQEHEGVSRSRLR